MKYRPLVVFFFALAACNSVTVVPIDDEDAAAEASIPANDAGGDSPASDATTDGGADAADAFDSSEASDASGDG